MHVFVVAVAAALLLFLQLFGVAFVAMAPSSTASPSSTAESRVNVLDRYKKKRFNKKNKKNNL